LDAGESLDLASSFDLLFEVSHRTANTSPVACFVQFQTQISERGNCSEKRFLCVCKDDLINAGATWVDAPAFRDGNLVWGRIVADLPAFCRELIATLALAAGSVP